MTQLMMWDKAKLQKRVDWGAEASFFGKRWRIVDCAQSGAQGAERLELDKGEGEEDDYRCPAPMANELRPDVATV